MRLLAKMKKLKVEIADTPSKQQTGLMFRKHLSANAGMLFSFERPRKMMFWGQNTYIPLDIAFVDEDNRIRQIAYITPLSTKAVRSDERMKYALEANAGYFSNNDIKVGTKINIENDEVSFIKEDK